MLGWHGVPLLLLVLLLLLQEYYGIAGQSKWANLGYVCCFFVFFL